LLTHIGNLFAVVASNISLVATLVAKERKSTQNIIPYFCHLCYAGRIAIY